MQDSRRGLAAAASKRCCWRLAVILLNAIGNLSLTWGMRHIAETMGLNPVDYVRAMINPFVAGGIGLLILWLLTRMALMSWADLSFVLPVTSIGYVLVAFLGHVLPSRTCIVPAMARNTAHFCGSHACRRDHASNRRTG